MVIPKLCPVCGQDSIEPVMRKALVTLEGESQPISGVLAYRCANGHTFLVTEAYLEGKPHGKRGPQTA
jgi:hypothetical protein